MPLSKLTLAVLTVCTLAACGKGGGGAPGMSVSSDQTDSIKSDSKTSVDRSSDLTAGRTAKLTSDADFAPLLNAAVADALPATGIAQGAYFKGLYHGQFARPHVLAVVDTDLKKLGFAAETGTISDAYKTAAKAEQDRLDSLVGASNLRDTVFGKKLKCLEFVQADDYAKARTCYDDYLVHAYTLHVLQSAVTPKKGHDLPEENRSRGGNIRIFPAAQLEALTYGMVNSIRFANAVQDRLKDDLSANTFRDKADGQQRTLAAIFSIPAADLRKMARATATPDGVTLDVPPGQLGSDISVNVLELAALFTQSEKGVTEQRGGAIYSGDGYISGVKVRVAMERSVGANSSTKTSTGESSSVESGASDKADVSLGVK